MNCSHLLKTSELSILVRAKRNERIKIKAYALKVISVSRGL